MGLKNTITVTAAMAGSNLLEALKNEASEFIARFSTPWARADLAYITDQVRRSFVSESFRTSSKHHRAVIEVLKAVAEHADNDEMRKLLRQE